MGSRKLHLEPIAVARLIIERLGTAREAALKTADATLIASVDQAIAEAARQVSELEDQESSTGLAPIDLDRFDKP